MTRAVLFAGQGAEEARMGVRLAERSPRARALLERASRAAGLDVLRELSRGGAALARTEVLQPTLVAVCLGALAELQDAGVRAEFVAGHSLGELCAWVAAGGITAEDAVDLAGARGALMAREATAHRGGMVALTDADEAEVRRAVERASAKGAGGSVTIAAHNAPREWVLSGTARALAEATRGIAEATRLPSAGAWHSEAMAGAVEAWRAAVGAVRAGPRRATWVSSVTGEAVAEGAEERELLVRALTEPVRWAGVLATLAREGVRELVVAGPGRVLRGLARKNLGAAMVVHVADEPEAIEACARACARRRGAAEG